MEATRIRLAEGVHLTYLPARKFKTSLLSAQFVTPLRRETAGANALLAAVLRRGTVSCPDMGALSAKMDNLYDASIDYTVRKKGENQCVGFVASFLDDAFAPGGEPILEPAAGLLGELLLRPRLQDGIFAEEYVSGERANLVDRIRGQINDKRSYATLRLGQLMCGEEAFGVDKLGDVEHAAAVTPGSLWERYQQLLSTAQIELYYCGSAEEERVARALKEALSALPVNEGRICPDCEVRLHAGPEPSMVEESMDVTQGKLAMGFRTGGVTCWEEEYPAMAMCNAVFGGTTLSKLFMNVREKLSLCYYASSTLEKMKGLILVSSGIEFDKFQQARDEILHQLEEIRQGNMEDWELEGTRRTMIGAHLATLDVQDRQEDFWLGQTAAGLETGIEELVAQLEQVTREQVAQAAQKLELDTIYFLKGTEG